MPAAIDRCVRSLTAKWKSDPSKRPAPKKEGQSPEDQAWAICTAAHKRSVQNSLGEMFDLEDDVGAGPTFIGAAATNRPYIPRLKPTKVIEEGEGEKKLLVHLANPGFFNHPLGSFVLNRAVFLNMMANFRSGIIGQEAAYDCRHKPDDGAYGWFEGLMFGDEVGEGEKEFWGKVNPTPVGLERIEGKQYQYSSMEFHRNYERSDVVLDLERATDDFCPVDFEELEESEENVEDENMGDNENVVSLEELEEARKALAKEKQDREAAEKRAEKAMEMAMKLQQDALDAEVLSVVTLAKTRRDEGGNSLPRQLIEWTHKFLALEDLGEDKDVIRLEEGVKVPIEVRRYLIAGVRHLLLTMPGVVPAERQSQSGSSQGDEDKDDFDYKSLWDEEEQEE